MKIYAVLATDDIMFRPHALYGVYESLVKAQAKAKDFSDWRIEVFEMNERYPEETVRKEDLQ